jgi:hypothetical protein
VASRQEHRKGRAKDSTRHAAATAADSSVPTLRLGLDESGWKKPAKIERIRDREAKIAMIADQKPDACDPRTHAKKQIHQVADSIKGFGSAIPILIDADNVIVSGRERLKAAKFLGIIIEKIP